MRLILGLTAFVLMLWALHRPRWQPGPVAGTTSAPAPRRGPALNGRVDALYAAPHSGSLPDSLYAGGVFTSAGGDTTAVSIARWDGSSWHSLGAPALNGGVDAIAVDRHGNVYVGGAVHQRGRRRRRGLRRRLERHELETGLLPGHRQCPGAADHRAQALHRRHVRRRRRLAAADKLLACDLDEGTPRRLWPMRPTRSTARSTR